MGKRIELTEVYRPKPLLKGRSIGKTTVSNIVKPERARKSKDTVVGAENVAGEGPAGHVISGETNGRPAAGPATDPVTVGSTKRGDEVGAPDVQTTHAPELPQPPQPSKKRAKRGTFDRVSYQKAYMADLPLAKAEGLTVAEYRKRKGP